MNNDNDAIGWMVVGLIIIIAGVCVLFSGCTTVPVRPSPTPEQMPQGRQECRALCASYGRQYLEYRYNGDCVCKSLAGDM